MQETEKSEVKNMKNIETGKIMRMGHTIYFRLPKAEYEARIGEEVVVTIESVKELLESE